MRSSPGVVTIVARRSLRFRLASFFVRMWLLFALKRFSFPVPVSEKRFRAPLCDFIFGIRRYTYFGDRIIVSCFPSIFAGLSIFEMSASSVATRSTTA